MIVRSHHFSNHHFSKEQSPHLVCRWLCQECHCLCSCEGRSPLQHLRQAGHCHTGVLQGCALQFAACLQLFTCTLQLVTSCP